MLANAQILECKASCVMGTLCGMSFLMHKACMTESKQSGMIAWSGPTCVAHDAGDG